MLIGRTFATRSHFLSGSAGFSAGAAFSAVDWPMVSRQAIDFAATHPVPSLDLGLATASFALACSAAARKEWVSAGAYLAAGAFEVGLAACAMQY